MAALFQWVQRNGAAETHTTLGTSGNLFNYSSLDASGISHYISNPVTAGQNSFEIVLRGRFSGSFNRIDDVRFWMSTNFSPATGLTVKFNGQQVIYLQPSQVTSSIATSSVPTSDPGSANVTLGGSLTGSLTSSGATDNMYLQLQTTTAAPPGDTAFATWTISYNEN